MAGEESFRIFGKLVHINDVDEAAELMDCGEGTAALDASFDPDQEKHRQAQKNDVVDPRLDRLNDLTQTLDTGRNRQRRCHHDQHAKHASDQESHRHPQEPVGTPEPGDTGGRLAPNASNSPATRKRPDAGNLSSMRARSRLIVATIWVASSWR